MLVYVILFKLLKIRNLYNNIVTYIITLNKHGGMVKNLNHQCGGEGFKSSHLQTSCTKLLG
jgi:hypothetical protein